MQRTVALVKTTDERCVFSGEADVMDGGAGLGWIGRNTYWNQ